MKRGRAGGGSPAEGGGGSCSGGDVRQKGVQGRGGGPTVDVGWGESQVGGGGGGGGGGDLGAVGGAERGVHSRMR